MASIWSIGGNDIYVDTFQEKSTGQVAELNPINTTSSTFHDLFVPTTSVQVGGTVIGDTAANAIRGLRGSVVSLVSDLVPGGFSVLVQEVSLQRIVTYRQSVDSGEASDAPVYKASLVVRPQ